MGNFAYTHIKPVLSPRIIIRISDRLTNRIGIITETRKNVCLFRATISERSMLRKHLFAPPPHQKRVYTTTIELSL